MAVSNLCAGAYQFFSHRTCEYFPCHPGVTEADFNCLFCFCPLYALGEDCGGDYIYTVSGCKDCSGCSFPHRRENYGELMKKAALLVERTNRDKGLLY